MNDTHPEVDRVWVRMPREAGPERRGRLASQLSNQVQWRAMEAIARTHPDLSGLERKPLFVNVHFGAELAKRIRAYLECQDKVTNADQLMQSKADARLPFVSWISNARHERRAIEREVSSRIHFAVHASVRTVAP